MLKKMLVENGAIKNIAVFGDESPNWAAAWEPVPEGAAIGDTWDGEKWARPPRPPRPPAQPALADVLALAEAAAAKAGMTPAEINTTLGRLGPR